MDVHLCRLPLVASGNDLGSPVVWAAHWCFSVRSLGPETFTPAHVRLASVRQRAPSWRMLEPLLFFGGHMICATPYIVMWDKKAQSRDLQGPPQ